MNYLFKNNAFSMQNININSVRSLNLDIRRDEYFDAMLYRGEVESDILSSYDDCLAAFIDTNSEEIDRGLVTGGKELEKTRYYSHNEWVDSINEGVELKDIGFTGVDNGFISYRKDIISNKEFYDLFTGSTYTIDNDKRFFMTPITGNTLDYQYPLSVIKGEENYFSFKGGFLQGFFKLDGLKYQTLPSKIEDEWCLSFVLRRRGDYELENNILNKIHPENSGIFFFMGTRAENKFWKYYNFDSEIIDTYKKEEYNKDGYFEWDNQHVPNCDYVAEEIYLKEMGYERPTEQPEPAPFEQDINTLNLYDYDENNTCDCIESERGKRKTEEEDRCDRRAFDEEYWEKNIPITSDDFITSEGIESGIEGYYEIETDNKFITFNRTETGYTVDNWDDNISVVLTGTTRPNINLFPLMNRTETGYTVETYDDLVKEYNTKKFNILNDIKDNVFALKINEDGSIGYRFGVLDCDEETHYNMVEEYSFPNVINEGEWTNVVVRLKTTAPAGKCDNKRGRKMKMYFYVNGKLVFVSKELPALEFRKLDEAYQKQEGVPFNLSLGGGTQGLAEVIYPDYYAKSKYVLPLEKDFAGTFIGDLKSFKFYACPINFGVIRKFFV